MVRAGLSGYHLRFSLFQKTYAVHFAQFAEASSLNYELSSCTSLMALKQNQGFALGRNAEGTCKEI